MRAEPVIARDQPEPCGDPPAAPEETREGAAHDPEVTVTLRIKPDRRRMQIAPERERRHASSAA